jgi:hypothetical protein
MDMSYLSLFAVLSVVAHMGKYVGTEEKVLQLDD